jgi:predicted N-acetyltransferase YhbS
MRVDLAVEPDLAEPVDAAIRRLQVRAFPRTERMRNSRHDVHVARPGDVHVLAWAEDVLVGQVVVFWAEGRTADRRMPLACLGNVCSDPDYRGRGLASACMTRAMELAADKEVEAVLLFCGREVEGFYARFGFATIDNPLHCTRVDGTTYLCDHHDRCMAALAGDDWPSDAVTVDIEDF